MDIDEDLRPFPLGVAWTAQLARNSGSRVGTYGRSEVWVIARGLDTIRALLRAGFTNGAEFFWWRR